MRFAKIGRRNLNTMVYLYLFSFICYVFAVFGMANILSVNVIVFFSIRPQYLMDKTGTFAKIKKMVRLNPNGYLVPFGSDIQSKKWEIFSLPYIYFFN